MDEEVGKAARPSLLRPHSTGEEERSRGGEPGDEGSAELDDDSPSASNFWWMLLSRSCAAMPDPTPPLAPARATAPLRLTPAVLPPLRRLARRLAAGRARPADAPGAGACSLACCLAMPWRLENDGDDGSDEVSEALVSLPPRLEEEEDGDEYGVPGKARPMAAFRP